MKSSIRSISRRAQAGFTMIELIVVIVILGILAATALPKFIDLRSEATQSAIAGVAGNLGSAAAVNYAGCAAKGHAQETGKCETVASCRAVGSLLQGVTVNGSGEFTLGNATYTIVETAALTNGATATCTLTTPGATNVNFTGIGAGNP